MKRHSSLKSKLDMRSKEEREETPREKGREGPRILERPRHSSIFTEWMGSQGIKTTRKKKQKEINKNKKKLTIGQG